MIAGLTLTAIFAPDVWEPVHLGTPMLGPGVAFGTGVFVETVLSFLFVLTILQMALDTRAARHVHGFAIGLVLVFAILVGGPITGAALNPARAFGPALASGTWIYHMVFWVGPVLGSVLATVAYSLLRPSPEGADEGTDTDILANHDDGDLL